jgi:ankyrin repeat protein
MTFEDTLPMRQAVIRGDANAVRRFLDEGFDLSQSTGGALFDASVLHIAADSGHVEIAKILIDAGADVNLQDFRAGKWRDTPLHLATTRIYEKTPPDPQFGWLDMVDLLLTHGADPTICCKDWLTPLHRVLTKPNFTFAASPDFSLIAALVERGVSSNFVPDGAPKDYLTPFQYAVKQGRAEEVRFFLLHYGEDPAQRTIAGRTMAQVAATNANRGHIKRELLSSRLACSVAAAVDNGDGQIEVMHSGPRLRSQRLSSL